MTSGYISPKVESDSPFSLQQPKWTAIIEMNSKISAFSYVNAAVKASAAKMGGTLYTTFYAITYFTYIFFNQLTLLRRNTFLLPH